MHSKGDKLKYVLIPWQTQFRVERAGKWKSMVFAKNREAIEEMRMRHITLHLPKVGHPLGAMQKHNFPLFKEPYLNGLKASLDTAFSAYTDDGESQGDGLRQPSFEQLHQTRCFSVHVCIALGLHRFCRCSCNNNSWCCAGKKWDRGGMKINPLCKGANYTGRK